MRKIRETVICDGCGNSEIGPVERLSSVADIQRVKLSFEMPDINIHPVQRTKDLCMVCRSKLREKFIELIGE